MQQLVYPAGHRFRAAFHRAGHYYVLTWEQTPPTEVTGCVSTARVGFLTTAYERWTGTYLIDHPTRPGPSLLVPDRGRSTTALHLTDGTEFTISDTLVPENFSLARNAWLERYVKPYTFQCAVRALEAYDDRLIVTTGREAYAYAGLLIGPTRARELVAVRGLRRGRVVIFVRGGGYTVMRLPKSADPVSLVLAPDGLTVLAACRDTAYVIDLPTD